VALFKFIKSSIGLNFDIENSSKFSYLSLKFKSEYSLNDYYLSLDCNLTVGKQRTISDIDRGRVFSELWQRTDLDVRCGSTAFFLPTNSPLDAIEFIKILNKEEPIDEQSYKIIIYCIENSFVPKNDDDIALILQETSSQLVTPSHPASTSTFISNSIFQNREHVISQALKAFIISRWRATDSNLILTTKWGLDAKEYDLDCTLTLDFPVIPISFNGRLFDYDELIKLSINGFITDPQSREVLSIQTIQPDYRAQKEMDKLIADKVVEISTLPAEAKTNAEPQAKINEDISTLRSFKK
jgi:hypothetical protein